MRRLAPFLAVTCEQLLLGFAAFVVSWMALRTLDTAAFGIFSVCWSLAWSAFAVVSEGLLNPLRVEAAREKDAWALTALRDGLLVVGLALIVVSAVTWAILPVAGLPLAAIALWVCASAFHASRAAGDVHRRASISMARVALYAAGSVGFGSILMWQPHPTLALLGACCSLLLAAVSWLPRPRIVRRSVLKHLAVVAARSKGFAAATALRVTFLSSGLIAVLALARGAHEVALYAAVFVVVAPVQVFSQSLPWLLLPRLAAAAAHGNEFRREAGRQLLLYAALAAALVICYLAASSLWLEVAIGNPAVRRLLHDATPSLLALAVLLLLSSLASSTFQAIRAPRLQLVAVLFSAAGTFTALAAGVGVLEIAFLPYLLSVGLSVVLLAGLALRQRDPLELV